MRATSSVLLAMDTSTRAVGLALYDGVRVLCESVWVSRDHHTVELAPAVASALEKTGLSAKNLGALAVATGPGSFTGLRIGLAMAKGLAIAQRIPILGIPTLDALALAQPILNVPMAAVLRAGRGRLAVSWYRAREGEWKPAADNARSNIEVLTPEELAGRLQEPTLLCGELDEEDRSILTQTHHAGVEPSKIILATPAHSLRRPAFLAELAWQRWKAGQADNPASLAPIYLHYNDPILDKS
ncbi:MAG: tRNA (adenosine(37)-N6)-threonylcarbamoyltransferase complex dimerization subunit type 1 TsaB [Chloroflexota bacterium]